MGMGTEARVLGPESLKELVKDELHGALSYYTEPIESYQEQPVRDNMVPRLSESRGCPRYKASRVKL